MLVGVGGSFGGNPEIGFLAGGVLFGAGFVLAGIHCCVAPSAQKKRRPLGPPLIS